MDKTPDYLLTDLLAEVDREIKMRQHVYPRRVAEGKMAQTSADRQIALMQGARHVLLQVLKMPDTDARFYVTRLADAANAAATPAQGGFDL